MAVIELAVDFGTSNITIFKRGEGIILKEASVAIIGQHKKKREVVEVGNAAKNYVRASMGNAREVYPISEGIVVNVDDASLMMKEFIKRVLPDRVFKPQVKALVMISVGLSVIERRDVETVMINSGVSDVVLVESPLALLAYTNSVGGLFLDIGGGTAEVASVSKSGIANACSVNIAGNLLNGKIIDYFVDHYGMKIGDYTAEKLKIDVGSMYDNDLSVTEISGRDVMDGTPRSMEASAKDIKAAISKSIDALIETVESVLNMTPPELAGEISKKGIFISGGTSEFPGLIEYIGIRLSLPVTQLKDYYDAVTFGGGLLLEDSRALNEMLNMKVDG